MGRGLYGRDRKFRKWGAAQLLWPFPLGDWAEAYLHTRWHPNPSTVWPQYANVTNMTDKQNNGRIAYGEPFYKRSPNVRYLNFASTDLQAVARHFGSLERMA